MVFLQKISKAIRITITRSLLLGIVSLGFMSALAETSTLEEGKDYIILKTPIPNADKTLIEVISYRCIHCYNHHRFGTLEQLRAKIPNITYNLFHTNWGQGYHKELNALFAYAQLQDSKEGKDASDKTSLTNQLAAAYFQSYFEKRENLEEERKQEQFMKIGLDILKISQAKLDGFLATKEAQDLLKNYQISDEIVKNYGTPAFVVNGKYQIHPNAFDSVDILAVIVEELLKKP
ncbi:MAG: thiol:disulfide interchange protein DsbA/DsbL [Helicobacter sp.]|nr:thiol:disulfide interchange protein DsbA/DsbL [Helicobacter sp.]